MVGLSPGFFRRGSRNYPQDISGFLDPTSLEGAGATCVPAVCWSDLAAAVGLRRCPVYPRNAREHSIIGARVCRPCACTRGLHRCEACPSTQVSAAVMVGFFAYSFMPMHLEKPVVIDRIVFLRVVSCRSSRRSRPARQCAELVLDLGFLLDLLLYFERLSVIR